MNIPQAGSRRDLASVTGEWVSQGCDGRALRRRGRGRWEGEGEGGGGGRGGGAARGSFHRHLLAFRSLLLVFLCVHLLVPETAAQSLAVESTSDSPTTTTTASLTIETGRAEDSLPTLFDTNSISSNSSTTTCPAFFAKFLADKSFLACLPLSGLLLVITPVLWFFPGIRLLGIPELALLL